MKDAGGVTLTAGVFIPAEHWHSQHEPGTP
jgi:hypothetical protein